MGKSKPMGRPKKLGRRNAFKRWMEDNELSVNEISDKWGISRSFIYGLMNGSQTPGREKSIFIAKKTRGAVTVDSW